MPLWQMIGNDCCLGVESGDNATAVAGACETVGWMLRFLEKNRECDTLNNWKKRIQPPFRAKIFLARFSHHPTVTHVERARAPR